MLNSAKQKIERAKYHIADLERQFASFVSEKPHRFVLERDPETGDTLACVEFLKEPPPTLALIVGDAVHNLRCALDHAAWEVVGADGGTQDRHLKFPTGDSRINFEASCNGIKTPSERVKKAFAACEAFLGGGGTHLYDLNKLDNDDKHVALKPVLRATSHPPIEIRRLDGVLVASLKNSIMIGGIGNKAVLARVGRGQMLQFQHDGECPPSIFSRQPTGGQLKPTIPFLKACAASVSIALQLLERHAL